LIVDAQEDEMQADIVTASRWLGASIVLASGIIAGGLLWARPLPVRTPDFPVASGQPAQLDADVLRQSAEPTTASTPALQPGLEVDLEYAGSQRTPILDPLPTGSAPASCLDPPSETEVFEKLPKPETGLSQIRSENVHIVVEKIGEKVDPCKVYPLAGPCQLVHCHYKCSVTFDELSRSDYPVPFNHVKHRVEVVYIDKDHLRRCAVPEDSTTTP
jgi:hypothetical protein